MLSLKYRRPITACSDYLRTPVLRRRLQNRQNDIKIRDGWRRHRI